MFSIKVLIHPLLSQELFIIAILFYIGRSASMATPLGASGLDQPDRPFS